MMEYLIGIERRKNLHFQFQLLFWWVGPVRVRNLDEAAFELKSMVLFPNTIAPIFQRVFFGIFWFY